MVAWGLSRRARCARAADVPFNSGIFHDAIHESRYKIEFKNSPSLIFPSLGSAFHRCLEMRLLRVAREPVAGYRLLRTLSDSSTKLLPLVRWADPTEIA